MAGYSNTPLAQKLGIKSGSNVLITGAPAGYLKSLEPLPAGVRIANRLSASVDVAHLFTADKAALENSLAAFRRKLGPTAIVWVSWPKKKSGVPTQVNEDIVRRVALPMGFVDVKVCAIDDVWSGLKLVVRKTLR
jgi:hypothetical protein